MKDNFYFRSTENTTKIICVLYIRLIATSFTVKWFKINLPNDNSSKSKNYPEDLRYSKRPNTENGVFADG